MKSLKSSLLLFLVGLFFVSFSAIAQDNQGLWEEEFSQNLVPYQKSSRKVVPKKEKIYRLNLEMLKEKLGYSSLNIQNKQKVNKGESILPFPDSKGNIVLFKVRESSVMDVELQKKYPEIRSYVGVSTEDASTIIRFSVDPKGFHSMTLSTKGAAEFIDPYTKDALTYSVVSKDNLPAEDKNFLCKSEEGDLKGGFVESSLAARTFTGDANLRVFRLALACTGEYSQYHLNDQGVSSSATDAVKKAAVLSAMNTTLTRLNGVFERELAVRLELVANNDEIVFLNSNTDGFTDGNALALIGEVQGIIDNEIGFSNYDIGHVFSTGDSGVAELASVCTSRKAQGVTGSDTPKGDAFDIDYVAHEMGHQFGATHTFNNSCNNNITSSTAVEPGSGSTIMAYAGICAPNIQSNSDAYFHSVSINQIQNTYTSGNATCGELIVTNDGLPNANAGSDCTIPKQTPFVLQGTATFANTDLEYNWEQTDTERKTMPPSATSTGGPLFRSIAPSSSSKRYFPSLETVLNGSLSSTWEVLPEVGRSLDFNFMVRGYTTATDAGETVVGLVAIDGKTISVDGSSGPFVVTSQEEDVRLQGGESVIITWDVANTDEAPVNVSHINILLSTDGGLTFSTTLAENVPNNGMYSIVVPVVSSENSRIKVEAVGNVFYSINKGTIAIDDSLFVMSFEDRTNDICESTNEVTYNFEYANYLGYTGETVFECSGTPEGAIVTISPTSATVDGTEVEVTISNLGSNNTGRHTLSFSGTGGGEQNTVDLFLNIFKNEIEEPELLLPINYEVNLFNSVEFEWREDENALEYDVQVATDEEFSNIIGGETVETTSYLLSGLEYSTQYFWRVRAKNICGEGGFSTPYSFNTGDFLEKEYEYEGNEVSIPDNDTSGIASVINVTDVLSITNVKVTVDIEHTYLEDLSISLKSPENTTIVLVASSGGDNDDLNNVTFDDTADETIAESGDTSYSGSYKPKQSLAGFIGNSSEGDWTLKIVDAAGGDVGTLNYWSLEISGVNQGGADTDSDGILDSVDNCVNTFNPDQSDYDEDGLGDVCDSEVDIVKEDAFSPNSDGINDYWVFGRIDDGTPNDAPIALPKVVLEVFTKQGELVYKSDYYKNDWDGTSMSGGLLPRGSYIYRIYSLTGEVREQKGWVYINY